MKRSTTQRPTQPPAHRTSCPRNHQRQPRGPPQRGSLHRLQELTTCCSRSHQQPSGPLQRPTAPTTPGLLLLHLTFPTCFSRSHQTAFTWRPTPPNSAHQAHPTGQPHRPTDVLDLLLSQPLDSLPQDHSSGQPAPSPPQRTPYTKPTLQAAPPLPVLSYSATAASVLQLDPHSAAVVSNLATVTLCYCCFTLGSSLSYCSALYVVIMQGTCHSTEPYRCMQEHCPIDVCYTKYPESLG